MAEARTGGGKAPTTAPKKPKAPKTSPALAGATEAAFRRYLDYLRRFQSGGNPFAEANRLFPGSSLGPTYNPQQLRQQAQAALKGMYSPRINQIRDTYANQMRQGSAAITGYTGTYANRLGQIPVAIANANAQGLQQQAAVGGALADYMRDTGNHIADDLTQRLADANLSQGQIEGTVGNAAQTGFIGSGEIAGLSSASLMRMADEGNAWLKWGQALPGIGILQGGQELGKFAGQLNDAFTQQMGDLQSDMSAQGVQLYQSLLDRELERRSLGLQQQSARAGYISDTRQQGLNAALGGAGLLQNWAQMLLDRELGMAGINADLYGTQASIYGTDVSAASAAADRAAANKPGGANYPGDIKTKEDLKASLSQGAAGFFPAYSPIQGTPGNFSYHQMRKRVMSYLRSNNGGPFALGQRELEQLRDQILAQLGYAPQRKKTGSQPQPSPSPDAQDAGDDFSFPWFGISPLIPNFPW